MDIAALRHRLEHLGLRCKKRCAPRNETGPTSHWPADNGKTGNPAWPVAKLVFLEETGLHTKMTRLYGWAHPARRSLLSVPHGHWSTATFIAALRHDRLPAPLLLDGAMDGAMLLAYV